MRSSSSRRRCCGLLAPEEGGGFGNQIAILLILLLALALTVTAAIIFGQHEHERDQNGAVVSANATTIECLKTRFSEKFDDAAEETLKTVSIVAASFSFVGSTFILFSWLVFPRLRTFPFRLVMYLSIADIGSSIFKIMAVAQKRSTKLGCIENSDLCRASGFLSQFFDVAGFIWIFNISLNLYLVLVKKIGDEIFKYERLYHIFAWGIALILSMVPWFYNAYGAAGGWCWIQEQYDFLRMIIYYVPMVLVMFGASLNFLQSSLSIRKGNNRKAAQESSRVKFRLHMYILVFILLHFFSLLNRIHNIAEPLQPNFILYFLQGLVSPLKGFGNAVIYGLNKAVVSHYRQALSNCLQSARVENQVEESSDAEGTTTEGPQEITRARVESPKVATSSNGINIHVSEEERSPWEGMSSRSSQRTSQRSSLESLSVKESQ
jgi:hypothetical protein